MRRRQQERLAIVPHSSDPYFIFYVPSLQDIVCGQEHGGLFLFTPEASTVEGVFDICETLLAPVRLFRCATRVRWLSPDRKRAKTPFHLCTRTLRIRSICTSSLCPPSVVVGCPVLCSVMFCSPKFLSELENMFALWSLSTVASGGLGWSTMQIGQVGVVWCRRWGRVRAPCTNSRGCLVLRTQKRETWR